MLENLRRFREPAAWLVIVLAFVSVGIGVARPLIAVRGDWAALPLQLRTSSAGVLGLALLTLLVASALACVVVRPVTTHSRAIVTTAAIVASLAAVVSLAYWGVGLWASPTVLLGILEAVGGLVDVSLKVLGAIVLWRALTRVVVPAVSEPAKQLEPADPTTAPTWSRDKAAGASTPRTFQTLSIPAAPPVGGTGGGSGPRPAPPADPLADLPDKPRSTTGEHHSASRWATEDKAATATTGAEQDDDLTDGERASRWQPVRRDTP